MIWKTNLKKFSQMQHREINNREEYKLKDTENRVRKFNLNLNRVPKGKGRQCIEPDSKSNASLSSNSFTQLCLALCDSMDCSMPGFPVHHQYPSLLRLISIELVMPSHHLILCSPLLLPPSIFPNVRVLSKEPVLHIRWPDFSFSISPSNEYSGLISFQMDWLDLLSVQGTLMSHLQHHSSKASTSLSFLYSPTLTSIHDYWKNHSFDETDFCW